MLGFSLFASIYLSLLLGQDASFDLLNYHYYNPYSFLNNRNNIDLSPAQIQTFFNPTLDLIPYYIIQNYPPWVFGVALGAWQGLNLWLVYILSLRIFIFAEMKWSILFATFCSIFGFIGPITITELGTTHHDTTLSVFIIGSVYLYITSLIKYNKNNIKLCRTHLTFSGFMIGISVGLKLTFAIYAIGIILAIIIVQLFLLRKKNGLVLFFAAAIFGFIVAAGHWMYFLWVEYRNPLFPLYNNLFHSPFISYEDLTDKRFLPKSFIEAILFPIYFNKNNHFGSEVKFQDFRIAALFIISLAWLTYTIYKFIKKYPPAFLSSNLNASHILLWLLIFIFTSYIVWLNLFAVYRYLICIELLTPLTLLLIVGIYSNKTLYYTLMILLLSIIISLIRVPDFGRVRWSKTFFGVQPPKLPENDEAIVLITSDKPLAYVIPSFPISYHFIRIESNFINPSKNNYQTNKIKDLLKRSLNNIYILTDRGELNSGLIIINQYLDSKSVEIKACEPVYSRIQHSLVFCSLSFSTR